MSKTPKVLCITTALVLGFIQVAICRFFMTLDGVSYLDMADAYLRHDWHTAINGDWNPLYSWVIGLGFLVLRPSSYWEYPVVHLVNFGIFALTVLAFEYFLQGLLKDREDPIPLRILAYAIFIWTSVELIRVWMVEPDMLVAASFYAGAGILLHPPTRWTPFLLAATLAAGYYAKAVMFPISIMVLIGAWIGYSRRQALLATVAFAMISSPLIVALSLSTGHPTFSDTSRLNYAWYVDGVAKPHWEGEPARAGKPLHPAHAVLEAPKVYEFGDIFPVTCPLWYNESYWYRGLHLWIAPRALLHNALMNSKAVAKIFIYGGGGFLLTWAIFAVLQKRISTQITLRPSLVTWFVSLGAVLLYIPVHVEPRYMAPFTAVLFLVPFTAIHIPGKSLTSAFAMLSLTWTLLGPFVTHRGDLQRPWEPTPVNAYWPIVDGLQRMGLKAGDKIGTACSGMGSSRWARLGKFHIAAQMADDDPPPVFWGLSTADQKRVLAAFFSSGVQMIVTDQPPPNPDDSSGWQRIGTTNYYSYSFATWMGSLQTARMEQQRR